jgi:plastocyanin
MLVRVASLTCLLLAALIPASGAGAQSAVLTATVGTNDAFSISLTDASGAKVTHLDAGTYTINVHDLSSAHNFHLIGPGVDKATVVESTGDETWTVTFTDGIYRYQCDPHASVMNGRFAVGTAQLAPPTATLTGRVGPGKRISVRNANGSKATILNGVASIKLVVTDSSRTDNFHLIGPGVNRSTGVAFRGKRTWNLTNVQVGVYRFRSDRHKTLRGSFSVTASGT